MLWLFVGPTGVYLMDFFCSVFSFIYCWVLIFALSPCYILIYMLTQALQWNILLTIPRRYFFCGSFMFFLSCVYCAFVHVCLYAPCGHLLGKGWPLGSRLWCLTVSLSLSHWYPGSSVVLDCIDSWSLHPYLLFIVCNIPCANLLSIIVKKNQSVTLFGTTITENIVQSEKMTSLQHTLM